MLSIEQSVVLSAFLIRLAIPIILPNSSSNLQNSIELSTLVTSFKSLKEGVFLYSNNINVYDGGVVHHSPLLILFMDFFIDSSAVLYPAIDALITFFVIEVAKVLIKKQNQKKVKLEAWVLGLVYALNPVGILSNIGRSSEIFSHLFIITSFYSILIENDVLSAISLALSAYLNYSSVYLLIPLGKLAYESNKSVSRLVIVFTLMILSLLFTSFKVTNDSWEFLGATYGVLIKFNKIAPNMGLWWYYFTEMFDFFIPFYTLVFNLYNIGFIIPLTARLDGTFSFILSIGWLTFGKPYAELGDLPLYLILLLMLQPVFEYLTYPVLSGLLLLESMILAPIFYHLWIDLGSGNSNFFYAITLVYSLGVGSTVADFTWGYLAKEYHESTGGINKTKKITQI